MNKLLVLIILMLFVSCGKSILEILDTPALVEVETPPDVDLMAAEFIDSAVKGVRYYGTYSLKEGITDISGTIICAEDEEVELSIGEVYIGTVFCKSTITPIDIITRDEDLSYLTYSDLSASQLTENSRLLSLLQSLDTDGDHTNGIIISTETSVELGSILEGLGEDLSDFEMSYATDNFGVTGFDINSLITTINGATNETLVYVPAVTAQTNFEQDTLKPYFPDMSKSLDSDETLEIKLKGIYAGGLLPDSATFSAPVVTTGGGLGGLSLESPGIYTFTPTNPGSNGEYIFTYTIIVNGITSDDITITITTTSVL